MSPISDKPVDQFLNDSKDGNFLAVRGAINSGIDINCTNSRGWTPLMLAARYGRSNIVDYLLGKKADVNVLNNFRKSATYFACRLGHDQILEVLLEHSPNPGNVSLINQLGDNAFLATAVHGHYKCAELLLKSEDRNKGVDHIVFSQHRGVVANEAGKTAVQLAWDHGHQDLAVLIINFERRRYEAGFSGDARPILPLEILQFLLDFLAPLPHSVSSPDPHRIIELGDGPKWPFPDDLVSFSLDMDDTELSSDAVRLDASEKIVLEIGSGWWRINDPEILQPYFWHGFTRRTYWHLPAEVAAKHPEQASGRFSSTTSNDARLLRPKMSSLLQPGVRTRTMRRRRNRFTQRASCAGATRDADMRSTSSPRGSVLARLSTSQPAAANSKRHRSFVDASGMSRRIFDDTVSRQTSPSLKDSRRKHASTTNINGTIRKCASDSNLDGFRLTMQDTDTLHLPSSFSPSLSALSLSSPKGSFPACPGCDALNQYGADRCMMCDSVIYSPRASKRLAHDRSRSEIFSESSKSPGPRRGKRSRSQDFAPPHEPDMLESPIRRRRLALSAPNECGVAPGFDTDLFIENLKCLRHSSAIDEITLYSRPSRCQDMHLRAPKETFMSTNTVNILSPNSVPDSLYLSSSAANSRTSSQELKH